MSPRYYSVVKGRGYWQPTRAMRARGFKPTACGPDGPSAWAAAEKLSAAWDACRRSPLPTNAPMIQVEKWLPGSIGDAFHLYRSTYEWDRKAPRTREDWERGWKYIGIIFGKHNPLHVTMPIISEWRRRIEEKKGLREAHRALKIWRALWKVMAALKYCQPDQDPSLAVVNTEPKGRSQTWTEGEAVRLVKGALRMGYPGLAVALACMWDGAVAPVDARLLTLAHRHHDNRGTWFELRRAKTGRDGILTISRRTESLLHWYLTKHFSREDIAPDEQLFRTKTGVPYRRFVERTPF